MNRGDRKHQRIFLQALLIICLLAPATLLGQKEGDRIFLGEFRVLKSNILNEDRNIIVYTPPNYETGKLRYPVLYLLDGPRHFHHVTGIVDFLSSRGVIPELIVVAVSNTDRNRDFLPTRDTSQADRDFPSAGGADNFQRFFNEELFPFVESNYRTVPYRILVGHSFGGLFAVYTLITQPDMFAAYIAVSPTFWWDNELLYRKARELFASTPSLKKFLYISMGNEGDRMVTTANRFETLIEDSAPSGFRWDYAFMQKENHATTPHRTVYDGLEELYEGWSLPQEIADLGLEAVEDFYAQLSEKYGYTIQVPENVLNIMGYTALAENNFDIAQKIFEKNIALYPWSANVYDSAGDCYRSQGKLNKARESYAKAVELGKQIADPNLPIYRANLETVEKELKR